MPTQQSKYHIKNADPTSDDIRIANVSWFRILSRSAEGFLAAQESHDISAEITPVVYFYETFFSIWKTKSIYVLDAIYRNNLKLKSSSMIAMVGYILGCKNHSSAEIEQMVERHTQMGVSRSHYTLMGEVIIETIQTVLKKDDHNDDVIVAWRRIVSWMIERIDDVYSKSKRRVLSYI